MSSKAYCFFKLIHDSSRMGSNTAVKILILVVALFYFTYTLYWLIQGAFWLGETLDSSNHYLPPTGFRVEDSQSWFSANLMDYAAFLGLVFRFVGGFFAVFCAIIIFRSEINPFLITKRKLPVILFCEAAYFLSLVPSVVFLLFFSALPVLSNLLLSAQLTIQVLLVVPCLVILGLRLRSDRVVEVGFQSFKKWFVLLFVNYLVALWVSYLLKWLELFNGAQLTLSTVLAWLIENSRLVSLLNTTCVFSAAVIFALVAAKYTMNKGALKAIRWWGLSSFFVGLFYLFYVLYCLYLGALWVIPFGELWLISLFFVGVYLLGHNSINKAAKVC